MSRCNWLRAVALRPRPLARAAHSHADLLARAIPVLNDVQSLVARSLAPGSSQALRWDTLARWSTNEALAVVEHGATRQTARIGVLEWDEAARAKQLVTALLDDPLSSDEQARQTLRDRWNSQAGNARLLVRNGSLHGLDPSELSLGLSWLRRLNVEVLEIARKDDAAVLDLLHSDIPLIILSGLQLHSFPLLDTLRLHPTARIVINNPMNTSARGRALLAAGLREHLGQDVSGSHGRVHLVDSESATRALDVIRDTRDPRAVQSFQELYMDSHISPLLDALEVELGGAPRDRTARIAVFVSQAATRECELAAAAARTELDALRRDADALQLAIDQEKLALTERVLGKDGDEAGTVATQVKKAEEGVASAMDGLRWWQVPLNVDDLGYIVKSAVNSSWCAELEKRLAFHAGLLQASKTRFEDRADALLASLPESQRSLVLVNEIERLKALPAAAVSRDTLSAPIVTRRELIGVPTATLHRRAQQLVRNTLALSFGGTAGSYLAWSAGYLDGATAVGLAALLAVATLRWAIGRWEKAQRNWWADWHRVGEGLARDVQREFIRCLNERVFLVPQRLCDRLSERADIREKDIREVEAELVKTREVAAGLSGLPRS